MSKSFIFILLSVASLAVVTAQGVEPLQKRAVRQTHTPVNQLDNLCVSDTYLAKHSLV
jgi:hypothetical protein